MKMYRFFSSSLPSKFFVEPLSCFLNESTRVFGKGFQAGKRLTVKGRLACNEEDFDFTSIAHISTDSTGCFNLCTTPSTGGTYTGIEDMGLFWSMESKNNKPFYCKNPSKPLKYTFTLFNGHLETFQDVLPISECSVTRSLFNNNILRKEIDVNGLKGTLYIPEGNGPFPAAITMHGSVKNKHVIEDYAATFANKGFVMLALAFYGVEGLPSVYTTQPINIEYFEKAIEYLQSLDTVSKDHIGVVGSSKGGELALAMSSFLPQVKFCCLFNPHISSAGTETCFKGEKIEKIGTNFDNARFLPDMSVDVSDCLEDPRTCPEAMHKFTRSNADTFFVVGEKDLNWKSYLYADIYEEEMKKAAKTNFKISRYPNLGHIVGTPNSPIVTKAGHLLIPKEYLMAYGGSDNLSGYAHDIHQVWQEVYKFMEKQKPRLPKL